MTTTDQQPTKPWIKGRGALSRVPGRFERQEVVMEDPGNFPDPDEVLAPVATELRSETARTIISRNTSPDIGFSQSVNLMRGCEHGCVYCFARPSHAYLDLSPGLDFERKLFFKENAIELLRSELSRKGYVPSPIALGINTDSYQPSERRLTLTRQALEVFIEFGLPVTIVTKGALATRDLDLGQPVLARVLAGSGEVAGRVARGADGGLRVEALRAAFPNLTVSADAARCDDDSCAV